MKPRKLKEHVPTNPDEWLTLEPSFVALDGEVVYER